MKFVMVMIICFGADCEALFNKEHTYDSYNVCYQEAIENANFMRQMFPSSAGEVHCWDEERFKLELEYLGKKKDAEWGLKYDSLQASFDGLQFKYDNVIEIKDNEIQVLRKIAIDKKDYSMWWYAGGFLSGVALCLGVLYAASHALGD